MGRPDDYRRFGGAIGLGDLVRAIEAVGADHFDQVVALLDLGASARRRALPSSSTPEDEPPPDTEMADLLEKLNRQRRSESAATAEPTPESTRVPAAVEFRLVHAGRDEETPTALPARPRIVTARGGRFVPPEPVVGKQQLAQSKSPGNSPMLTDAYSGLEITSDGVIADIAVHLWVAQRPIANEAIPYAEPSEWTLRSPLAEIRFEVVPWRDDEKVTIDSRTNSNLAELRGERVGGPWSLTQRGRYDDLVEWELEIELDASSPAPTIALPDELPATRVPFPFEPLLRPEWTRGIAREVLATRAESHDLDLDRVVDKLAACEPLVDLPRLPIDTLSGGGQILVDLGEGMAPFATDRSLLVDALREVGGDEHFETWRFRGCPLWGVESELDDRFTTWQPPTTGAVVVITDLGVRPGSNATVEEWERVLDRLAAACIPTAFFVPYSRDRWPARLRERIRSVEWDVTTNATSTRVALRKGQ